jgi:hypothetical protein
VTEGHNEVDLDETLLAELRAVAAEVEPTPPELLTAARGSYTWRTIDAELAELSYDSLLDTSPAGVRGSGTVRRLTFTGAGLTVELEVDTGDSGKPRLTGQLVPPHAADVQVRNLGSSVTVEADEVGRFSVAGVRAGPISLRYVPRVGTGAVETGWVVV